MMIEHADPTALANHEATVIERKYYFASGGRRDKPVYNIAKCAPEQCKRGHSCPVLPYRSLLLPYYPRTREMPSQRPQHSAQKNDHKYEAHVVSRNIPASDKKNESNQDRRIRDMYQPSALCRHIEPRNTPRIRQRHANA